MLQSRRRGRLRDRVVEGVDGAVRERLWNDVSMQARLEALVPAVEDGRTTPLAASEELMALAASVLARTRSENTEDT
jgi:hypothetical protein